MITHNPRRTDHMKCTLMIKVSRPGKLMTEKNLEILQKALSKTAKGLGYETMINRLGKMERSQH